MKKAIYISLLLFSNIIMLAHAVVPHHHHNGLTVALLETDYDNKNQRDHEHKHEHQHEHQHGTNSHNHDNNGSSEQCALNEAYTRSDNDLKIRRCESCDYKSTKYFLLKDDIIKFGLLCEGGLPFRQKPIFGLYPPNFSVGSTGLRAPPFC